MRRHPPKNGQDHQPHLTSALKTVTGLAKQLLGITSGEFNMARGTRLSVLLLAIFSLVSLSLAACKTNQDPLHAPANDLQQQRPRSANARASAIAQS